MPSLLRRLFDRLRYGKIYQPTDWQRELEEPEAYLIATVPPLPEAPVLHLETGEWRNIYLAEHPELCPWRRVEFFTDEDWTRIQAEDEAFALSELETCKVTAEQTAKYKAVPWWMK